ncbi:PilZ domain-containing protein [Celerinatantimonas sp. YJH-8]|uniref:PilZ domain-containing protein n=1 Tax=Celerinatantimonas sp. YJH-8 TaxID=3228714 RepID=UPI0038CAEACE
MNEDTSYFSVAYQLNINVSVLPASQPLPEYSTFLEEIPESFRMTSPHSYSTDLSSSLQSLGEAGVMLQRYLKSQADKLDMLLSYVLSLQDDPAARTQTTHFGGSQLRFHWETPLATGQQLQLKVFLPEEATAIYCYGRVTACSSTSPFNIECEYALIREEDREALVRASLHVQSKLLQARAKARQSHDE